jgi:hypothetical protein
LRRRKGLSSIGVEGFKRPDAVGICDSEQRRKVTGLITSRVPKREEYPHTPGVFVRVAIKGVTGYGTWKSVRKMGDEAATGARKPRVE